MRKLITNHSTIKYSLRQISKLPIKNIGFTTLEIIVSLTLFVFIILLVNSIYILAQRSYNQGVNQGELVQNARVVLDRMSREIRQSVEIITVLPTSSTTPANQIFFQDGHDISQITYIKYYASSTEIMRARIYYYFDIEDDVYVRWNSEDEFGYPPEIATTTNQIVGEYFNKLAFWSTNELVHISLNLTKNQYSTDVDTSVISRNW